MRERKRLKLAQRQLALAVIARREAIAGLAEALSEQERSTQLAQRSRELARHYAVVDGFDLAGELSSARRFSGALDELASDAERAREDATNQAEWQASNLAHADHRKRRMEEFARDAHTDFVRSGERRNQSPAGSMARKLQSMTTKPSGKTK